MSILSSILCHNFARIPLAITRPRQQVPNFLIQRFQAMRLYSAPTKLVFTNPPENFRPKMYIAAVFCEYNGKFLFLLRPPGKSCENTWGIPGGKVDAGETAKQGALRELVEETGLQFAENEVEDLGHVFIRYPSHDFIYYMFRKRLASLPKDVVINPLEHKEARWLTLQEALKLPLIPGETECIHHIYGKSL